ncbi:hypothetical protein [Desulforamulus reducens]|uniref:hypothetical protein n=1 Tax=Desulforamulus reducens TaxID=59610 RepID=UPI0003092BBB|nr:hypothetical protein [Desulforamulus reducens]
MNSITGLVFTGILASGIGYLTIKGFYREAINIKNGSCCGSESCGCGGSCGGCGDNCCHDKEIVNQHVDDVKKG